MDTELIEVIGTQGAWALLSVALIFYILKAQEKRDELQEKRELKYQEIIENMANRLDILEDLSEDIKGIKVKMSKILD